MKMKLYQSKQTKRYLVPVSLLALFGAVIVTGCKHEAQPEVDTKPTATAGENAVGNYVLTSVDGKDVPCKVEHGGHAMTINSGGFAINADGSCSSKILLAGNGAIERKASYTQQGPKLKMKWRGAGTTIGTVGGDKFTMNNEGMMFAYRKE
jgi:hypothetical protein